MFGCLVSDIFLSEAEPSDLFLALCLAMEVIFAFISCPLHQIIQKVRTPNPFQFTNLLRKVRKFDLCSIVSLWMPSETLLSYLILLLR